MECLELHKFQKLTQPCLLMTAQPLWFGEHAFDHFSRLMPVAINACLHECFAGPRTGAVRGYDVSDDGSELINNLHGATSFNIYDPYLTAELSSGSGNLRLRRKPKLLDCAHRSPECPLLRRQLVKLQRRERESKKPHYRTAAVTVIAYELSLAVFRLRGG
jgi:hypothetical protein